MAVDAGAARAAPMPSLDLLAAPLAQAVHRHGCGVVLTLLESVTRARTVLFENGPDQLSVQLFFNSSMERSTHSNVSKSPGTSTCLPPWLQSSRIDSPNGASFSSAVLDSKASNLQSHQRLVNLGYNSGSGTPTRRHWKLIPGVSGLAKESIKGTTGSLSPVQVKVLPKAFQRVPTVKALISPAAAIGGSTGGTGNRAAFDSPASGTGRRTAVDSPASWDSCPEMAIGETGFCNSSPSGALTHFFDISDSQAHSETQTEDGLRLEICGEKEEEAPTYPAAALGGGGAKGEGKDGLLRSAGKP